MCGIWLSVGLRPSRNVIDVISHRGPDGEGWREFDSPSGMVVLGHRRLAIVDLSDHGQQPMAYARKRFWLTYNGEVYNHLELRAELEQKGHRFASRTDSEVILAAYAEWGSRCLERFNGMFAFAIWDTQEQKLFAARDRFGIKPLYIYKTSDGFALASEIKQFTVLPGFEARLNLHRAYDFLSTGMLDHTGETLFAGVEQLRGGETLTLSLQEADAAIPSPQKQRWYNLPSSGSLRVPEKEAVTRYHDLLADSVRLRLRADVPVGSCLSGGLDSSSIVSLINQTLAEQGLSGNQKTFSAVYPNSLVDETHFVDMVVEKIKVKNYQMSPAPQDLYAMIKDLAWHQDEPFGSTSIFAQWEVFRLSSENGVKVMLDGQGADEQLGGYHYMYGKFHAGLLRSFRLPKLVCEMIGQRRCLGTSLSSQLRSLLIGALPERTLKWVQTIRHRSTRPDWLDGPGWNSVPTYRTAVPVALAQNRLSEITDLGSMCRAQVIATNLPQLLHYEDRNSMAHSIEARVPFLDHRLVEFAIGLGDQHKIVNGLTKHILRAAMRDKLPKEVIERRDKLGFPTPEKLWLQGPLQKMMWEEIASTARHFPDLFVEEKLMNRVRDVVDGTAPFDFFAWRVVSFGIWAERFNVKI